MDIINFNETYVEAAKEIAHGNYNAERRAVPALPEVESLPGLSGYAHENRGVAAVSNGKLLGFFCWLEPWENHFGLTKGTWSPVHAHGVIESAQNRAEIYDRLYQAAAEKLVAERVLSHSVSLYEHDAAANESFAHNGFGRRTVDAIRETTAIPAPPCEDVSFREADENDAEAIAQMNSELVGHLRRTPMFMPLDRFFTADDIKPAIIGNKYKYFVACDNSKPVAYLRVQETGETFAADDSSVMNISGAYTLPEYRGKGVSAGLLSWLINRLKERGCTRCGVDYECFNYTARKFWGKYFAPYTSGVVRRIDERI